MRRGGLVERACPACGEVQWLRDWSAETAAALRAAGLPAGSCGGCARERLAALGLAALRARLDSTASPEAGR